MTSSTSLLTIGTVIEYSARVEAASVQSGVARSAATRHGRARTQLRWQNDNVHNSRVLVITRIVFILLTVSPGIAAAQQRPGRIEGRVLRAGGEPVGGVSVVLNETSDTAITSNDGRFSFGGVPAGRYSLTITLGEKLATIEEITVMAGATTPLEHTVDWTVGFTESLVVSAPSRRVERIIDAPGAVTSDSRGRNRTAGITWPAPKLLEFSPGVQVTQSGSTTTT